MTPANGVDFEAIARKIKDQYLNSAFDGTLSTDVLVHYITQALKDAHEAAIRSVEPFEAQNLLRKIAEDNRKKAAALSESFEAYWTENSTSLHGSKLASSDIWREAYERGLRSVEPAKIVLPQRKIPIDLEDYEAHRHNDLLDTIKRLNAGAAFKIEGE